jgi:P27 family predicted phage terminase small subunit
MGVLTGADMAAFAGYCQNYARWKEAEEHLTEDGPAFEDSKGKVQHSPYLRVSEAARRDMLRFASEFGLTPSSRSRIVATTDPGENFSGDPMEALLREG